VGKGQLAFGFRPQSHFEWQATIMEMAQSKLSSTSPLYFTTIQGFLFHFADYFDCT